MFRLNVLTTKTVKDQFEYFLPNECDSIAVYMDGQRLSEGPVEDYLYDQKLKKITFHPNYTRGQTVPTFYGGYKLVVDGNVVDSNGN